MTDHDSYAAVINRIISVHIEERGLQDPRGEADLIGRGIVVCVDRLWGHVPFCFVYRFSQFIHHLGICKG